MWLLRLFFFSSLYSIFPWLLIAKVVHNCVNLGRIAYIHNMRFIVLFYVILWIHFIIWCDDKMNWYRKSTCVCVCMFICMARLNTKWHWYPYRLQKWSLLHSITNSSNTQNMRLLWWGSSRCFVDVSIQRKWTKLLLRVPFRGLKQAIAFIYSTYLPLLDSSYLHHCATIQTKFKQRMKREEKEASTNIIPVK